MPGHFESKIIPDPIRVSVRHAEQADQHGANISGWVNEFTQITPGPFEGLAREIWIGPIQLFHDVVNQAVRYRGCSWNNSRVLMSLLPQHGPVHYGEREIPPQKILSHRWDDAARVTSKSAFESTGICVDERVLEEHASSVWDIHLQRPQRGLYQPETGKDIQVRLLQLLDRICACPKILENPLSRGMIVDDILEIVVTVMGADTQSWGRPPPSTTRAYIVYKAQQFIEQHLATGFSMSELCTTLRVSRRTLEYAFRDIIGASPKRYILALRLGRARQEIVVGGAQISITEIAERWGFFHPGRFGAVYKDFFHERPSETAGVNLGR